MSLVKIAKYCIFAAIGIISCNARPSIPISNTLEIALRDRYSDYVSLLNKSAENDSISMTAFLSIDNIYDGASYDHGWVVIQLMKKVGDQRFFNSISKMDRRALDNLSDYIKVGMDGGDEKKELLINYPLSLGVLGFNEDS